MTIDELDLEGVERVLREESRPVLIDFWSPWCAPCRPLRRQLEQLAEERREDSRIVAVNAEQHPAAAERFAVSGLPTLILFKGEAPIHRFTGPTLPSEIDEKLAAATRTGAAGAA